MGGEDTDDGLLFQEYFAILRLLELWQTDCELFITYEPGLGSGPQPADIMYRHYSGPECEKLNIEYWQCKKSPKLNLLQHLKILHDLTIVHTTTYPSPGNKVLPVKFGVVSGGPLPKDVERLANMCATLNSLTAEELLDMPKHHSFFETYPEQEYRTAFDNIFGPDRSHFSADILKELASVSIRDHSFEALRYKILRQLELKFGIEGPAVRDPEIRHYVGTMVSTMVHHLRTQKGITILARDLFDMIAPAQTKTSSANGLDTQLDSIQNLTRDNLFRGGVSLHQLFVAPSAKYSWPDSAHYLKSDDISNAPQWMRSNLQNMTTNTPLLVLGDFGQGKTSLLKAVAVELANSYKKHPGRQLPIPIFIVLRECFLRDSFEQAIQMAAKLQGIKFSDEIFQANNWVFLCDGFDELYLYHQNQQDWVLRKFQDMSAFARLPNVRVVISSRPILFMGSSRHHVVKHTPHLRLEPFTQTQQQAWLDNWNTSQPDQDISYEDLSARGLDEISSSPVILLLIASMFKERLSEHKRIMKRFEVYKEFFSWTADTGGMQEDGVKHPVPDNYREEILPAIAWTIFTHPDAQSGSVHADVLNKQVAHLLHDKELPQDNRLFLAHAFKDKSYHHIEFIHQSLREFLVAEAMFNVFAAISDTPRGEQFHLAYEGIICDKPITLAKAEFFTEMVRAIDGDKQEILSEKSQGLYYWPSILYQLLADCPDALKEQILYRENQKGATAIPRNLGQVLANFSLLGLMFEVGLQEKDVNGFPIISEQLFSQWYLLHNFIQSDAQLFGEETFMEVLASVFSETQWRDIQVNRVDLTGLMLSDIFFQSCSFINAQFEALSFVDNHVVNMEFNRCDIQGSAVIYCDFNDIRFWDCRFQSTSFEGNTWTSTLVDSCTFTECTLSLDMFKTIEFDDCRFDRCTFVKPEPILGSTSSIAPITDEGATPLQETKGKTSNCFIRFDMKAPWRALDGQQLQQLKEDVDQDK